ncbi:hypothetical protein HG263_04075 [Pseudoalteromonas sp. JBTF-M23]|uniref:DNA-binding winged helix-turn-helix (WHTH) protein n=1 Tax=Pseudoalteromonas caenipelagi TaxID=2726988 RepID=A0A849V8Q2_9GAMM|nr:LamG-like jellyroll fold domain-containing protein [Pseudoalteromonas caenipelagi]NOU49712.1 hypothetical protein [Pseudoalteromonas caenipelagi]
MALKQAQGQFSKPLSEQYSLVKFNDLTICFSRKKVYKKQKDIQLSELSYQLLVTLLNNAPNPVSCTQLQTLVWGNVITGEDNVKQRIRILRLALGQEGAGESIKNARGKGYYIDAKLTWQLQKELPLVAYLKSPVVYTVVLLLLVGNSLPYEKEVLSKHSISELTIHKEDVIRIAAADESQAFCFDGYDDYIEIADTDELDISIEDFSITAWIKTTALEQRVIVDKRYENQLSHVQGYVLFVDEGRLGFQLADGQGSWYCGQPGASCTNYITQAFIADGNWHHIAVSIDRDDSSGIRFFVDGRQTCSHDPTLRSGSLANNMPLRIGSRSSYLTGLFEGQIAEVALYHRALDVYDIASDYQKGNTRQCYSIATKGGLITAKR